MADISGRPCDVLIIGSGIGGLTATIAAKLARLKATLVEKLPVIGGSSAMSGGVRLSNKPLIPRKGVAGKRADDVRGQAHGERRG